MREEVSAYPELLELIETYIDGCAGPDADMIRSVFHPSAQLFGVFAGKTVEFPIEAWIDRVMGDPKPRRGGWTRLTSTRTWRARW